MSSFVIQPIVPDNLFFCNVGEQFGKFPFYSIRYMAVLVITIV